MRGCRLSDDYASLIFKYCDEHPDFTIKQLDALDAITRPRREWKVGRKFQGHMLPCSPPAANRQQTDQKKEEQKREETAKAKRAT